MRFFFPKLFSRRVFFRKFPIKRRTVLLNLPRQSENVIWSRGRIFGLHLYNTICQYIVTKKKKSLIMLCILLSKSRLPQTKSNHIQPTASKTPVSPSTITFTVNQFITDFSWFLYPIRLIGPAGPILFTGFGPIGNISEESYVSFVSHYISLNMVCPSNQYSNNTYHGVKTNAKSNSNHYSNSSE